MFLRVLSVEVSELLFKASDGQVKAAHLSSEVLVHDFELGEFFSGGGRLVYESPQLF